MIYFEVPLWACVAIPVLAVAGWVVAVIDGFAMKNMRNAMGHLTKAAKETESEEKE